MRKILFPIIVLLVIATAGYSVWQHRDAAKNKGNVIQQQSNQDETKPIDQTPTVEFNKKKYSVHDPKSPWVIANKSRALNPLDYSPSDLIEVGNGQLLRKEAATAFGKLLAAAQKTDLAILPLSGYRSYQTQVAVYNNEVARYGQSTADSQSARPGHSEHQTGLAIDVGGGGCGIEDCFGDTAEGKWLATNAYKYGFIVRYVPGKESITGYRAEPWHIRYVGTELSQELKRTDTHTLEEFFGVVSKAPY